MIESDSIAGGTDQQNQGLAAGQIDVDRFGRVAGLHHAALEQRLAIGDHAKLDASRFTHLAAIDAYLGREPPRSATQVNVENAYGVRPNTVLEGLSANRKWFARHGPVDFRFTPALLHFVQIERAQGNSFFCG